MIQKSHGSAILTGAEYKSWVKPGAKLMKRPDPCHWQGQAGVKRDGEELCRILEDDPWGCIPSV